MSIHIACGVPVALFAMGIFCAPAQDGPSSGASLQRLYDSAQRLQRDGDLQQAAASYRTFLSQAFDEVAVSRAAIGDYTRAASLFEEALALTPDSPSVSRDFATGALQAGDLKRAEVQARAFLNNVSSDPRELAQAHRILGLTLHKLNRDQEARKELEAAAGLDDSFQNQYDLGVVCLDLDDEQCAMQIFEKIETNYEDTPALHMQIGRAYGNSDFTPRAVEEFKKAIAEDPRYPGAHYSVAAALLAAGEDEKTLQQAEQELKTELDISPHDFLTYAALGKIEASYHRYPQAEKYLRQAIALNSTNPDAFLYLGQMEFDLNRTAEAEASLRKAIELTTDISRNHFQIQKAHFLLGRILMQQHKSEAAHAEMEIAHAFANKALSKDKNELAGLLANDAATASSPGASSEPAPPPSSPKNADPAAVAKQKAFEKQLAPAIADGLNNLGAIAASSQNFADALKYFEMAGAWNPSLDGLDLNLGRAAFMASDFPKAILPLSHYLKSHPKDSSIRGALAMSQFMTHNYAGCIQAMNGAPPEVASIPQMQYIYAESLVKTGQTAAGTERLKALESLHPEIADVHRALGEVFESRSERRQAIEEFRKAININPNDPETLYDLGKADLESGTVPEAITALESAVRLMPDEARYHQELAQAYDRAFRMSDAAKELRIYETLKASKQPVTADGAEPTQKNSSN